MGKECDKLAEVQRELSECREELTAQMEMAEDFDGQRRALADRLAAAEARERRWSEYAVHDDNCDLRKIVLESNREFRCDCGLMELIRESLDAGHETLAAALEQAREAGRSEMVNSKAECGHPAACLVSDGERVYCEWCKSLEQREVEVIDALRQAVKYNGSCAIDGHRLSDAADVEFDCFTSTVDAALEQARGFRDAWKAKAKKLREELNVLLRGIEHPGGLLVSTFDDGKREGAAEERERFEPLVQLCEDWLLIEARFRGEVSLDDVAHLMDKAHQSGQFTTQKMRNEMRAAVRAIREADGNQR